ncbi:ABC transporter ATP-binding protein [Candidatus Saccharibacteria bacterium]|nr:ABC transporter ATP-binding protein [Candidatus Saccharibacteria bacterium]
MIDPKSEEVAIAVRDVQQQFNINNQQVQALKQVDFSIAINSFTLVYGPSGSGKSTLLNVLAGLQPPTNGKVTVQGQDIYSLKPDELAHFRANRVGFMHQTNHWIKSLNVIENLSVPLYFLGYSRAKAKKLAMIALERVNMAQYAEKSPLVLSGGEQQRVAMARALANDPVFIIADEPTGNLDTENGDAVMNLLLTAQKEFRRTIILVTHNMEYISLADHLLKIQDGFVEDIPSTDRSKVMKRLLHDVNQRIEHLSEVKKNAKAI